MNGIDQSELQHFCIAGINYKKTDAFLRGQFAINSDQYGKILELAPAFGLRDLFVLSTCNRTEIFGFTDNAANLIELICTQTAGTAETFSQLAYTKTGFAAVEHLFQVAAGLDSQILGDYEIIGQIKQAVKFSREQGCISPLLERLVNGVLQSSKAIKNQTLLSGGTVSVSFAAVQYIRQQVPDITGKKILLLGTGKIGRNTCRNMVDYLGTNDITLVNRTNAKAAALAAELGLKYLPFEALDTAIETSDIILVATNAAAPTVHAAQLNTGKPKLVIDLSIPYNVEAAAVALPLVKLVNVDDLSKLKDETLLRRQAEVPRALAIIAAHINEFRDWHDMRRHLPILKAVKDKLHQLHSSQVSASTYTTPVVNFAADKPEARIQKVITTMAVKMRRQNQRGCQYIEAINDFMATGTN